MKQLYESLGISKEVYEYGEGILEALKERFAAIDETAEYNQLKVIAAMQKAHVSAECFNASSGYGYDDIGRDTLEEVYAAAFHTEDEMLGRASMTSGIHLQYTVSRNFLKKGRGPLRSCRFYPHIWDTKHTKELQNIFI